MSNTSTWTVSPDLPGYRTKTITRGKVTIVIHRPVLNDKERVKRENQVVTALTHYCKSLNT